VSKPPDDNDRAQAGTLPSDPAADTERAKLRVVKPGDRVRATEPAAIEAEDALVGSLLWAGAFQPQTLRSSAVLDILENGTPFYQSTRRDIYDAILACAAAKQEHDPVAVFQQLVQVGNDRSVGGRDAIDKLVECASTVSERQARVYASAIRDAWVRRRIIADARKLAEDARNPKTTTSALVDQFRKATMDNALRTGAASQSVSIYQTSKELFAELSAGVNTAMDTGIVDLDVALNGGLRPAEVSILAALQGVGKSTLAAQFAEHFVTVDPTAVALYVSLEMSRKSFTARLVSARSGVPMSNLRKIVLSPSQWSAITVAVKDLALKGIHFSDSTTQTLASIYASASQLSRAVARDGKHLALVVIDHVGLVKPSAEALRRANREQQVAETSRGLRYIAGELGCHVMGICHISREGEKESANRMPKPRHLRETAALENDADIILILHRERDDSTGLLRSDKPTALSVAKARLDDTAIMLLDYDGSRARFSNWTGDGNFRAHYGKGNE